MTRTFPKTQLTLFYCLLAAICFNMIDCTIVYCQTIQPGAEINNRSAQSESSIAVVSTSDIRSLPDNRRQPMNDAAKNKSVAKIFPNPFARYFSRKPFETGTVSKDSIKQLIKPRKAKSSRTASMEAAKQTAESEHTIGFALAQPISILPRNLTLDSKPALDFKSALDRKFALDSKPARDRKFALDSKPARDSKPALDFKSALDLKFALDSKSALDSNVVWDFEMQAVIPATLTHDSSVTWDFELQSEGVDRPHSSTALTTQPTRQIQAAPPNNTKLIYRPAVPTVDKQGRMVLKPTVMLSNGEIISGIFHSQRTHKRSVSPPDGPVATTVNRSNKLYSR